MAPVTVDASTGAEAGNHCDKHRHGAELAVKLINELNGGKGFKVGYGKTHYIKFEYNLRKIIENMIVNGATVSAGGDYEMYHRSNASSLAKEIDFWVGTCSGKSDFEKQEVHDREKILMAQVGPSVYYESNLKYIFGIHISSYRYSYPALSTFFLESGPEVPTVAIAGRDRSAFFKTTCQYAAEFSEQHGAEILLHETYEAVTERINDPEWQAALAKRIADTKADIVVGCIKDEELNVWIKVWRHAGYAPKGAFLTCVGWGWPGRVYSAASTDSVIYPGMKVGVYDNSATGLHSNDGLHMVAAGQWTSAMADENRKQGYRDSLVGELNRSMQHIKPWVSRNLIPTTLWQHT